MFHGESYGWETRLIEGNCGTRAAFPLKELAIQWAWEERKTTEG
jgi:hypothetical protein